MNKQRTPGYYWASLVNAEWEIMYWTGTCWNHETGFDDTKMDRINENRILSPDEKPKLPFIDEDAIKDMVSTYTSPNKDEPVVLGYTTDDPRDNFERAAQNRQTHSCDVAPNPSGPWAKGTCSCATNYGERQGCGAKESLQCYLKAQEYAEKVKEETQAHREKQIAETVKNSRECIRSTRNRLPSIINAILGRKL